MAANSISRVPAAGGRLLHLRAILLFPAQPETMSARCLILVPPTDLDLSGKRRQRPVLHGVGRQLVHDQAQGVICPGQRQLRPTLDGDPGRVGSVRGQKEADQLLQVDRGFRLERQLVRLHQAFGRPRKAR